jgi:hypothetical protein
MSDARNDYPRLCWGCLAVIPDYSSDYANLNYGGRCYACTESGNDDIPHLHQILFGEAQRMNSIFERDELLQEVQQRKDNSS